MIAVLLVSCSSPSLWAQHPALAVSQLVHSGTAFFWLYPIANFGVPQAMVVDTVGNVYVANGAVSKIDPTGAQLLYQVASPGGTVAAIAVDAAGSVYMTGNPNGGFTATPGA